MQNKLGLYLFSLCQLGRDVNYNLLEYMQRYVTGVVCVPVLRYEGKYVAPCKWGVLRIKSVCRQPFAIMTELPLFICRIVNSHITCRHYQINRLLTAMAQQLTYLYRMILPQSSKNTQRYKNGCACGEDRVLRFRTWKRSSYPEKCTHWQWYISIVILTSNSSVKK